MSSARTCPACGHGFIPWRIWRVTRWSQITCPACHVQLNRHFDAQFVFVCVVSALLPFPAFLVPGPGWVKLLSLCAFLLVFWLLDATTVHLRVARQHSNESKV